MRSGEVRFAGLERKNLRAKEEGGVTEVDLKKELKHLYNPSAKEVHRWWMSHR